MTVTVTVICAVLGLLAGASPAAAHAVLISTDPGQGAVIATVPATVSLTFGEPMVVAADGVRVYRPDGAEVDNGHAAALGSSSTVGVGLPGGSDQPQGTYTVPWRVISADSHPVAGAFTFSVGHPSPSRATPTVPPGSAPVGVVYAIVQVAAFASYALLVGSIAFVLLCWPGAIARRDVRHVMLVGWAGLLATSIATLLLQGSYGSGLGLDRLFDSAVVSQTLASRLGAALTARLLLLALAGGYVVLLCAWLDHLERARPGVVRCARRDTGSWLGLQLGRRGPCGGGTATSAGAAGRRRPSPDNGPVARWAGHPRGHLATCGHHQHRSLQRDVAAHRDRSNLRDR